MHIREARGYYYTVILQLRICGDDDVWRGIKTKISIRDILVGARVSVF